MLYDEYPHVADDLWPLVREVAEFAPDPRNARTHSERNLEAVKASLERFGQRKPIVVRSSGMVVEAGNCTLEAAKALGWTHLAAVVVDDDPSTATGYAIADNRTAELAGWDDEALAMLMREDLDEEDMPALGFDEDEVAELMSMTGEDVPQGEDAGAEEPPR